MQWRVLTSCLDLRVMHYCSKEHLDLRGLLWGCCPEERIERVLVHHRSAANAATSPTRGEKLQSRYPDEMERSDGVEQLSTTN